MCIYLLHGVGVLHNRYKPSKSQGIGNEKRLQSLEDAKTNKKLETLNLKFGFL